MSSNNQEKEPQPTIQIPTYPSIDTIEVEESVLSTLLKFQKTKTIEGVLFGRETGNSVLVSSAIPCTLAPTTIANLTTYLEVNRLDYMKIGFFCLSEESDIINKQKLKLYVEFQKSFPNSVIIFLDSNMKSSNLYPFKCFRIHKLFMEMVDLCEVEEDVILNGNNNNPEDFYQNIYKKFIETSQIMQNLKFTIVEDEKKLFRVLADKTTYEDGENDDDEIGKGIQQNAFKYSLNKKM